MQAAGSGDRARRGQVGSRAAALYEEWFVPALFAQWADPVADLALVAPGDRVLDVGCGTGVLARACAARTGAPASVAGIDPNPGMLDVARACAPEIGWHAGVAEELPWPEATFDRVVCQFALMFMTDPATALAEMCRVTRPGGRVVVATWAAVEESPGYASLVELVRTEVGQDAAAALLAPFSIGTRESLRALVAPALPDVRVARLEGRARFRSLADWLETDVRAWTLAELVTEPQMEVLHERARTALAGFVDPGSGQVDFAAPALVAVGER